MTKSSFRFGNKCPILILYYSLSFCLFRQFNNMLQFFEHFERECYVPQGDKTLFEGELLVFHKTNYSIFARYELRRCVRARTRAMCGRACACEIHSEKCAGCACVRLVFGRAMCDHTFAHFLGQTCQKMLLFVLKKCF